MINERKSGWRHPLFACLNKKLRFERAELKELIERAKSNDRCKHEYCGKHDEHDAKSACYDSAKIQVSEQSGDYDTCYAIYIGNIAFHDAVSFRENEFVFREMDVGDVLMFTRNQDIGDIYQCVP